MPSGATTPATTVAATPVFGTGHHTGSQTPDVIERSLYERPTTGVDGLAVSRQTAMEEEYSIYQVHVDVGEREATIEHAGQVEAQRSKQSRRSIFRWQRGMKKQQDPEHAKVNLTFADLNPFPAMWVILKIPSNAVILCSSGKPVCSCNPAAISTDILVFCFITGLLFAVQYTVAFTAAVTFAA